MAYIPFNLIIFPLLNDELIQHGGTGRLEILFTYFPGQLFSQLSALGNSGRRTYLIGIIAVEFVYPLIYSLFLAFMLTMLGHKAFKEESPLRRTQLFPFAMLVFHYISNISLIVLLSSYPAQPIGIAWIASAANTLKWCFGAFSLLAMFAALLIVLVRFTRQKTSQGASQ